MPSNLLIGVVLGISTGTWVYARLQRYTGGNSQSSLIGAALTGALVCLIGTTLLTILF